MMVLSHCYTIQFLHVGPGCYWTGGYLSWGPHIIWSGNEGATFHVSFQNQYSHLHTKSMLWPLDKRWIKKRGSGSVKPLPLADQPSIDIRKTRDASYDRVTWPTVKMCSSNQSPSSFLWSQGYENTKHLSILSFMPPLTASLYISYALWALALISPTAWGQSNEWSLTIANYAKWDWLWSNMLSLSTHSCHSSNELQQHTKGHSAEASQYPFTRHAIHPTLCNDGSFVTAIVCSHCVLWCCC